MLNLAIQAMDLANAASSITSAKHVFGSVIVLLRTIRVRSPLFSHDTF